MRPLPLTLALATLLTGCATTQATNPATTAAAPTVPIEQPTPAPSTASTHQPQKVGQAEKVGQAQTSGYDDLAVSVTVLRYRQPFKTNRPGLLNRKGYTYGGIEAKLCVTLNGGDPASVSWGPWALSYDSGIVAKTPSSWNSDGWDEPLYPQDHIVGVGRCARGWIPFEVPAGDKPAIIHYQPLSGNALEWRVS